MGEVTEGCRVGLRRQLCKRVHQLLVLPGGCDAPPSPRPRPTLGSLLSPAPSGRTPLHRPGSPRLQPFLVPALLPPERAPFPLPPPRALWLFLGACPSPGLPAPFFGCVGPESRPVEPSWPRRGTSLADYECWVRLTWGRGWCLDPRFCFRMCPRARVSCPESWL